MTALGRVQVIRGTPPCQPGTCVLCKKPEGTFIDFGFELDFYGVVYFCSDCIREVAEAIGFLPVDRFSELEERLQEQINRVEILDTENEELRNALDALDRIKSVLSGSDSNQSTMDEVKPEPDEAVESTIDTESAGEAGPIKQDDEPRFTGLPHDESIESIFKL